MATAGDTLYLAQWGGWSETRDGIAFVSRFTADLKDLPITALLPTRHGLYAGTQGRGLAECDTGNGAVRRWHDERQGIGDDWVTSLAQSRDGRIVIGTFVSGAFSNTADAAAPWQPVAGTENDCVTGTDAASDRVIVSLRRGGIRSVGSDPRDTAVVFTLTEAQCVLPDAANHLLWIGTRTGIVVVRSPE
jgi:ligand-binding sensor domain-containing protein